MGTDDEPRIRYWSTSLDQLENADTDPKTICEVLGVNYDANKTYKLAVIDTEKAAQHSSSYSIVPTHEKLGEFSQEHLEDALDPDFVPKVLNDDYAQEYAESVQAAKNEGYDIYEPEQRKYFTNKYYADSEGKQLFETRAVIDKELGANEHFAGNGLTKDLTSSDNASGVVETFSYDKNPQTLGKMQKNGSLVMLDLTPL